MEYKTSKEKLIIVFDIIKKLQNFETSVGPQDIFLQHHSYVKECTAMFNNYIKQDETQQGKLFFKEIGRVFEYYLPIEKNAEPVFVLRAPSN